ncbi:MAG: hypothetical protein ABIN97_04500 [Ginsengibacter sp.]
MKALIYILAICFISCSTPKLMVDNTEKVYVIYPGKGTNQLNIGTSKITSAFDLLGKNDTLEKKIIDGMDSAFVIYSYIYTNLSLTIISSAIFEPKGEDLDKSLIENIYFSTSAKAKTSNGIVMNKSTLEEVLEVFGKPDNQDEYADVTILHYRKKGISFIIEKAVNTVTGIEVYKENGNSSHL